MVGHTRIGQLLVDKGLISIDQLETALEERGDSYVRFGEVLVSKGWVTENDVLDCLAQQYGIPVVDTERLHCNGDALRLVSEQFATSRAMLPVQIRAQRLQCVIADPLDYTLRDALEATHGLELDMLLASPTSIKSAIAREYKNLIS